MIKPQRRKRLNDIGYLESLILKNTLDGSIFTGRRKFRLEDDAERTVTNDFALGVLHFLGFTRQTILDFFANNFCYAVSRSGYNCIVRRCFAAYRQGVGL